MPARTKLVARYTCRAHTRVLGGMIIPIVTARALATFNDSALTQLVDLDDPIELASRQLRPSLVATRERTVTQGFAMRIFEEGMLGLSWWSTLEATWPNVTLFAERASPLLTLVGAPELLSVHHPVVRTAAQNIGVILAVARR